MLLHVPGLITISIGNPTAAALTVIADNPNTGAEAIRISSVANKVNKFIAVTLASSQQEAYLAVDEDFASVQLALSLPSSPLTSASLYLLGTAAGSATSIEGFSLHSLGLWSRFLHSQTALKAGSLKIPSRANLVAFYSASSNFVNYKDRTASAVASQPDDFISQTNLMKLCSG